MDLTVILATVPERKHLLNEAARSLRRQTCWAYSITSVDTNHRGPAATFNMLADLVETTWLFPFADDDLLDPDHFEVLSHWLDDDADIVYTWCRVEGGGDEHPANQFQRAWQAEHGWEWLHERNWIPASAAIRTSLWRKLGGFREVPEEDWDFWRRALDASARFRCVPAVTWTYRLNNGWEHRSGRCGSSSFTLAPRSASAMFTTGGNEPYVNSATT